MSAKPEDDAPPTTGLVAGKYEVLRLIGRGGMGAVWEGRHTTLGTKVAIKFIDSEFAESTEARRRFENEAKAAARIESKHAIRIYDHGATDEGKPYIVMELLQGEPLDQRIDRLQRLPLADTARILRQVGRALSRAHEIGIVHRDLKPENIFLVRTPDEDDEIAKVLDFGIAKFKRVDGDPGTSVTASTKTGAVIGTPFYMSPEQARGLQDIDHRSDLWSLGVIAYKCVVGVLPFEGVSVGDLLVKICTARTPTASTSVPGLSPAFDAWLTRALEKEPAQRFQSATELTDALSLAAGVSVKHATSLPPSSDVVSARSTPHSNPANATSAPITTSAARAVVPRRNLALWWGVGAAVAGALGTIGFMSMGSKVDAPHGSASLAPTPPVAPEPTPGGAKTATTPAAPSSNSALPAPTLALDAGVIDVSELAAAAHRRHPHNGPQPAPSSAASTGSPAPTATTPAKKGAAPNELDPGY